MTTPAASTSGGPSARSASTSSMPSASARVSTTARVCGSRPASTTIGRSSLPRVARRISVRASPAAVPSSSSDALAVVSPVRSATIVWKLISASRRPWEISGWYGVYAVYQDGSSRTLRRMTAGVTVGW